MKIKKYIILFLVLFFPVFINAKGIEIVNINLKDSETKASSEYGYDFSSVLTEENKEITYDVYVKNTNNYDIEIKDIILSKSSSELISYTYSNIQKGDVIKANKEKKFNVKVKTEGKLKNGSIDTNFLLTIDYDDVMKGLVNPKTGNNNWIIILSIVLICLITVSIYLYFTKREKYDVIKQLYILLVVLSMLIIGRVNANDNIFYLRGHIYYKELFLVEVDPNGGKYNNTEGIYQEKVIDGGKFDLTKTTKEYYELDYYLNEENESITDEEIIIRKDTKLKAVWKEKYYTVSVNPNGGLYGGDESLQTFSIKAGTYYDLESIVRNRYDFARWEINPASRKIENGNKIFVDTDISLKALWNERYVTLVIDPAGGSYNNSSENYTSSYHMDDREEVVIDVPVYPGKRFLAWRMEDGTELNANTIVMTSNVRLTAVYEDILYNVNINPNGGLFNNQSTYSNQVLYNTLVDLRDIKRDGYLFRGFKTKNNTILDSEEIRVTEDITLTAQWAEIICRIGSTYYDSIMSALEEAQEDDIITLLKSTTEEVENTKKVVLDLNGYNVTGSLLNKTEGNITIKNGFIENPNGIAITNNGVLTLGENDLKEDGTSNIVNNMGIIGTTKAIKQNGVLNYYDGYLEGEIALDGGYDSSPYYRNTFDDKIVYYYPIVDHNNEKDCQHIELGSADLAVTKTSVHGDIYYYNVQDNINTSAITGYTIYGVRNFNASYPIEVKTNTSIVFDISGYDITLANTLTNNGNITVTDTGDIKGILNASKTVVNNSTLNVENAIMSGITSEPLMNNKSVLNMTKSTLTATTGYTYNNIFEGSTLNMDDNSYIRSTSTTNAAVYSTVDFEFNRGNIVGSNRGIYVHGGTTTISGGNVKSESDNTDNMAITVDNKANVIVNGGNISAITNAPEGNPSGNSNKRAFVFYINLANLTVNNGNFSASGTALNGKRAIVHEQETGCNGGVVILKDGNFVATHSTVTGVNNPTYPISYLTDIESNCSPYRSKVTIDGGTYNINSQRVAYGFTDADVLINGGDISISAPTVYGIADVPTWDTKKMTGGKITINATTTGYGINKGTNIISGGEIEVKVSSGAGYGINEGTNTISEGTISGSTYGINKGTNTITGGTINGSTYGTYNSTNTLGSNDLTLNIESPAIIGGEYGIYGGTTNFYDGVLKGKIASYQTDVIKAIPDGTIYHNEDIGEYHNTWLEDGDPYLEVNGTGYSSMTAAYKAVEGTGTIKVIRSIVSESVLPEFKDNKNVTLDLNGKSLTYSQPLINASGSLTITDLTDGKNGTINNFNINSSAITNNNGMLIIDAGYINSSYRGIYVHGGTLTVNGGTITSESDSSDNMAITVDNKANVIVNGGNISAITNAPEGNPSGNSNKRAFVFYINLANLTVNNGNFSASGTALNGKRAIVHEQETGCNGGVVILKDGNFVATHSTVTGVNNPTYPISYLTDIESNCSPYRSKVTIDGGTYNINSQRVAYGFTDADVLINGGDISISAPTVYGIADVPTWDTKKMTGGKITINATTTGYGINKGTNIISGGEIEVKVSSGAGYGINEGTNTISEGTISGSTYGINKGTNTITGGTINGSTYGTYNSTNTLGSNDLTLNIESPAIIGGEYGIYGGTTNFYDGVLKGKIASYQTDVIKAIPDGTIYHNEDIGEYHNTWLEDGDPYLEVNGTGYSSMTAAYKAVEGTGTIKVIRSIVSESVLPEFKDNKNVTLDLNGKSLTYSQPLINASGSLTITDLTDGKNGTINNFNINSSAITNNNGMLIIDAGYINSSYRGIYVHGGTLTVNGGTITSESDSSDNMAITVDNKANVIVNGGNISAITNAPEGNPSGNSNKRAFVFYINLANLTVNNGNFSASGTALNGKRAIVHEQETGCNGGVVILKDGNFVATHSTVTGVNNPTYPISYLTDIESNCSPYRSKVTIDGGTYNINSQRVAYGFTDADVLINGGDISISAPTVYGIADVPTWDTKMTGGKITINATTTGYGINKGTNIISGGEIEVKVSSGAGYGINEGTNTISGGTISGSTYGINKGTNTLGNNDGTLVIDNPTIIGGEYGIYGGTANFYDGVLKGKTAAYTDGSINNIATNSKIYKGTEQINSEDYHVDYLVSQTNIIDINGHPYTNLYDAITNATSGDTLVLIDNVLNTDPITIPTEKEITIDVSDYDFESSKPIINNGNVTIVNNSDEERVMKYYGSDYLITNNSGSTLTLENIKLESQYAIKNNNGGVFNGNNVNINSTNTAIYNLGKMNIDNFRIAGTNYAINNASGEENTITNSTITSSTNSIYNNSTSITNVENSTITGLVTNNNANGTLNFKDCTITNTLTSAQELINKGTMTINNSRVYGSYNKAIQNERVMNITNGTTIDVVSESNRNGNAIGINNTNNGILDISDTTINVNIPSAGSTYTMYGIYSTGSMNLENTNIELNSNSRFNHYGIYTENGNAVFKSGTIRAKGLTSYGVYLKSGTFTLGIPEEVGSATYGKENADVNLNSPLIESLGTTNGIGIKNDSQGLYYYDGKIVATTTPLPELPNGIEYLYESKEFEDDETGNKYVILKWMREQQG